MNEKLKIWNTGYDEVVEDGDTFLVIRHSNGEPDLESIPYSYYQEAIDAYRGGDIEWCERERKVRKGGKKK